MCRKCDWNYGFVMLLSLAAAVTSCSLKLWLWKLKYEEGKVTGLTCWVWKSWNKTYCKTFRFVFFFKFFDLCSLLQIFLIHKVVVFLLVVHNISMIYFFLHWIFQNNAHNKFHKIAPLWRIYTWMWAWKRFYFLHRSQQARLVSR